MCSSVERPQKTASEACGTNLLQPDSQKLSNTHFCFNLFSLFTYKGAGILLFFSFFFFSLGISSFLFELTFSFPFLLLLTSLISQPQSPRQFNVVVQGREACSHFFSTCIVKLPLSMTPSLPLSPSFLRTLNVPPILLLRKKNLNKIKQKCIFSPLSPLMIQAF